MAWKVPEKGTGTIRTIFGVNMKNGGAATVASWVSQVFEKFHWCSYVYRNVQSWLSIYLIYAVSQKTTHVPGEIQDIVTDGSVQAWE